MESKTTNITFVKLVVFDFWWGWGGEASIQTYGIFEAFVCDVGTEFPIHYKMFIVCYNPWLWLYVVPV